MAPSLPCKNLTFLFCSALLAFIITLSHAPAVTSASASFIGGNETDRLALLAIKAKITHDPLGITASWNHSLHFCSWAGVTCGHRHQRVTSLNLMSLGLSGSLAPHVGNLTFLTGINLEENHFHGEIPPEIGGLFRLRHLNLSNNTFSGEIPANLSGCSALQGLRLGFNSLTGSIPFQLGSLQLLEKIKIHSNHLTGSIPDSLGNLSSLTTLSAAVNNLEGSIPYALGKLTKLHFLGIGMNRLSGIVPSPIYNLSSLASFTVPYNQLYGTLPPDLGFILPNLQILNMGHNQFTGTLPASLSNASNLIEFDIDRSNFTGKVPIDFGGLASLWWLVLSSNPLGKGEEDDLSFMKSLTKCRQLGVLDLSDSQFGGILPESIANLSTNLVTMRLGNNQLSGTIPNGIESLVNLNELQLQKNKLTGGIPTVLGKLKMLQRLDMSENKLYGHIPSSLSNITQLFDLQLHKNQLIGNIPPSFGNFQYLQKLDLSHNLLNGSIPPKVMALSSLTISLNLALNQLSGPLPSEVGVLKNLNYLDVSDNMLSGKIPESLGRCLSLERLHMEGNSFEGSIPLSFSSLRGLQDLDLSRNNLSGRVPEFLQHFSLQNLNLSFNHFEGELPTGGVFKNATEFSVFGNSKLCGGIAELHFLACTKGVSKKGDTSHGLKLMIPLLSGLLVLVLIMSILIIYRFRKVRRKNSSQGSSLTKDLLLKVSYGSLLKATGGFSPSNLIGAGSFGSVYKGVLEPDETIVAVKVLHLCQQGAFKSFMAECKALGSIRHRNLVKVLTACSSIDFQGNDFKALVYEFMENGSLESWLHPIQRADDLNDDVRILGLLQRVSIVIDVAFALNYLHHHCRQPIVHCDIKPSNVLLDREMTGHVGDFGLARFVQQAVDRSHPGQSSSVGLKGTIGYAAPEYGMGSKVSTCGDVYSYGILLLEMFTGKKPTDEMFRNGLTLHHFVKAALPDQIAEILDPTIQFTGGGEGQTSAADNCNIGQMKVDQVLECLISVLRVGVACSVESPRERMDIIDAVKELQLIKDILLASGMNFSTSSWSMRFEGSSSRSAASN